MNLNDTQPDGFEVKNDPYPSAIRPKPLFPFITLFILLAIIYGNSLNGAWQFDDEPNIVNNQAVHLQSLDRGSIVKTFYGYEQKKISRPFAYLSFGLNHYFGGLDPLGYHAVNLAIHYLAAIILFLFVRRTLNLPRFQKEYGHVAYPIALLTACLWAVNPVHVTAVTYIVQRMASMAGLFYILSMHLYLIGRTSDTRNKRIIFFMMSALSAALAMGTKENAFMIPVSIYLYDLLVLQDLNRATLFKNLKYIILPAIIAAFFYIVFIADIPSLLAGYSIRPFTLRERLLTEPRVIVFYISLLLYPLYSRLMLTHDFTISTSLIHPWTTGPAILVIVGLLGLAVWMSRKKPLIAYCIIFYFLNHLIEGSIIPLELAYEHRNYIPSMLLFLPVAVLFMHILDYFTHRITIRFMIVALIAFILAAQGHTVSMYNYIFRFPYLLWSDNVSKAPNLSRPHINLGNILWDQGRYEEAYEHFEKAWKIHRFDRSSQTASAIYSMGRYHFLKKDNEKALAQFQTAANMEPRYSSTWVSLSQTLIRLGNLDEAENAVRRALANGEKNVRLNAMLGFILLKKKEYAGAVSSGWKTLAIDPEFHDMLRVLAEAYRRTGETDRAVHLWEKYFSHYMNDLEGGLALIDLYAATGQMVKLDGMIGRIMAMKGNQTWSALIEGYRNELADHAFEPDPQRLLSTIRARLKNQP